MYAKIEKPKENKRRAAANSVAQRTNGVRQGFAFVDNRPEAIIRRAEVRQGNTKEPEGKIKRNQHGIIQLKPADINKKWDLQFNMKGQVQKPGADRNSIPVSCPLNYVLDRKYIKGPEAIGGHLFKREYGGPDDYTNVVTWSKGTEGHYTGFEERYEGKGGEKARQEKAPTITEVQTRATFETSTRANDIDTQIDYVDSVTAKPNRNLFKDLLNKAIETIPAKVTCQSEGENFTKDTRGDMGYGDLAIDWNKVKSDYDDYAIHHKTYSGQLKNAIEKITEIP